MANCHCFPLTSVGGTRLGQSLATAFTQGKGWGRILSLAHVELISSFGCQQEGTPKLHPLF